MHGREVSQEVAAALRLMGVEATFLEGGIADWIEHGLPTHHNMVRSGKWVTREHPKIDRIACPWLIRRFIDPNAGFICVPKDQVLAVAEQVGGIPYDMDGVEFTHEGEHCSFDAVLRIYVGPGSSTRSYSNNRQGTDASRHDLSPRCRGLFALRWGNCPTSRTTTKYSDHRRGGAAPLFSSCRSLQAGTQKSQHQAIG